MRKTAEISALGALAHSRQLQRAWGLPHSRQLQRAWGLPHSRQLQRAWALPIRASKTARLGLAPFAPAKTLCAHPSVLRRPGGSGGASIPDPISNSAVNRPSANGTSS